MQKSILFFICSLGAYLCKWNYTQQKCIYSPTTCSDYKTVESCPCEWSLEDKCEEFSKCENYSRSKCPDEDAFGCEKSATGCVFIDCPTKTKGWCGGWIDNTYGCRWYDKNQCVVLIASKLETCSDLNDFKERYEINGKCYYSTNKTCEYKKCSDFSTDSDSCLRAYISRTEFLLCQVVNGVCTEMIASTLSESDCMSRTSNNYHYQDNKCQICDTLLSKTEENYENIILGIVTFIHMSYISYHNNIKQQR